MTLRVTADRIEKAPAAFFRMGPLRFYLIYMYVHLIESRTSASAKNTKTPADAGAPCGAISLRDALEDM